MKIWNIGYPRVGNKNEWCLAVRSWHEGKTNSSELLETGSRILKERWKTQHELGVDSIPLNDFSLWDPVLDTAFLFNLIPQGQSISSDWMASQKSLIQTLREVPWFRSSYQGFQPEWNGKTKLRLNREKLDWELQVHKQVPYRFHATFHGPWTVASISNLEGVTRAELLNELIPLYVEILKDLKKRGLEWVCFEEPAFCADLQKEDIKLITGVYDKLKGSGPKILISTYYDSPDPWLAELSQLPVQGFHYDVVAGPAVLSWIKTRSFPKEKWLGLGLVNGRNVWASSVNSLYKQLEILRGFHPLEKTLIAPSCSLVHLPLSKKNETRLRDQKGLFENLSFANERIEELALLKQMVLGDVDPKANEERERNRQSLLVSFQKNSEIVRNQVQRLDASHRKRNSSLTKRNKVQMKRLGLPKLPIVLSHFPLEASTLKEMGVDVVGSTHTTYDEMLREVAGTWSGFVGTEEGWVQQSGYRSVRPPLLVSDVDWKKGKPERISKNACTLGPISIVNSCFCRQDLPKEQLLLQVALAARSEIKAIETEGYPVIQVDEPGILDWLPLKKQKASPFLRGAVDSLKIATSGVKDETCVHLNIDSCDLSLMFEVLTKIDVDVLGFSSRGALSEKLKAVKAIPTDFGLAPGVTEVKTGISLNLKEMEFNFRKCLESVAPDKLWIAMDVPKMALVEVEAKAEIQKVIEITRALRRLLSAQS